MTRFACVAAPGLLFAYGIAHVVDGLDGSYGPGAAWTVGHLFFLVSLVLFGLVLFGLRREVSRHRVVATVAAVAGTVGLVVFIRSVVIDLIVGFQAVSRADMDRIYPSYAGFPGGLPTSFTSAANNVGPPLFILGLLALTVLLATVRPRRLPWWSPVLAAAGFALITVDTDLLAAGGAALLVALFPMLPAASRRLTSARGRGAPTVPLRSPDPGTASTGSRRTRPSRSRSGRPRPARDG